MCSSDLGGTGLTPRDVTPEATLPLLERLIPGIPEAVRMLGRSSTSAAILSRGVAGVARGTLVVNLPGGSGAVREHVQRLGRGPSMLLLHGTGASTHSFRDLLPALAEHFDVLAPDLPGHGFTARPDDPQLPLYAIAAKEDVAAVAFARIKTGDMRFMGLTREDVKLAKAKTAESWGGLFEQWKNELNRLAREFADGVAPVDPKRSLKTCRHCDLQPLCRVHERIAALEDDEAGDDE